MSDLYEKLYKKCFLCNGKGNYVYHDEIVDICQTCHGTGMVVVYVKRGTATSAPDVKEMERQSETEVMNGKTEK